MSLATQKFPAMYKIKPGNGTHAWKKHFAEEKDKMLNLKRRAEEFQSKVAAEIVGRKFGGQIERDFTVFPTIEMTKVKVYLIFPTYININNLFLLGFK